MFNADYPNFHILGFGGGSAPNTPITVIITTYTGPNLTGTATFTEHDHVRIARPARISRLSRDPPLLAGPSRRWARTGLALLVC